MGEKIVTNKLELVVQTNMMRSEMRTLQTRKKRYLNKNLSQSREMNFTKIVL